jgi:hypothetical protein
MTEMENKRVEDFLSKYKTEVPDKGFSRRVMHHLPDETGRLTRLVTWLTWIVFGILFYLEDGFRFLAHSLLKPLMTFGYDCVATFSWTTAGIAFAVLIGLIGYLGFYAED